MPVWLQQGLNEAWDLPKADQGTQMSPEVARALRFPEADKLAKYLPRREGRHRPQDRCDER